MGTRVVFHNYPSLDDLKDVLDADLRFNQIRIISSNAYFDGNTTMYFAAVEHYDSAPNNPQYIINETLNSIDEKLSKIEDQLARLE